MVGYGVVDDEPVLAVRPSRTPTVAAYRGALRRAWRAIRQPDCWWPVYVIAFAGAVAFFGEVLLGDRHFIMPSDTTDLIYPMESAISGSFQSGDLPLWLPENMGGFSLVSYAQYGLFYPLNWLFWLIPYPDAQFPLEAYHLKVVLHVALTATGTVFLCRQLGRSRAAALVAATTVALAPAALNYVVWGNSQPAFAWWPYCLGWMLRRGGHEVRSHIIAGGCLGLTVLASPAQPAIQLLLLVCLLTGVRVVADLRSNGRSRINRLWLDVRCGVAVLGVGLGLGSVSLLPILLDSTDTIRFLAADGSVLGRTRLPFAAFTSIRFDQDNLKGFLLPELSRVAVSSNYVGAAALSLTCVAVIAPLWRRRLLSRERVFLLLSLAVSVLYMFAVWLPHLFHLLPGLSLIREPARYSQIFILAAGVLAAFGIDDLRSLRSPWPVRVPAVMPPVVVVAVLVALTYLPGIGRERPGVILLAAGALVTLIILKASVSLASMALIGLMVWDLAALGFPSTTYDQFDVRNLFRGQQVLSRYASTPQDPYRIEAMRSGDARDGPSYLPNAAALVGAEDVWGYHNPVPAAALRAYNQSYVNPVYLQLLNVRYLVTDESGLNRVRSLVRPGPVSALPGVTGWTPELTVQKQDLLAVQNLDVLGQAWVVYRYEVVPPLRRAGLSGVNIDTPPRLVPQRDAVEASTFDPATTVVLEKEPRHLASVVETSADSSVEWLQRDNDVMTLRVRSPAAGVLVISDLYDGNWQAEVDGQGAEVLRADWMLNGVSVPSGESIVRLTYRPKSLLIALPLALAALLAVGASLLASLRFHTRLQRSRPLPIRATPRSTKAEPAS